MKILAIADEESAYLWDYFEKSKLAGIDLIISCGDLDPRYLSFLATGAFALMIRFMSIRGCVSLGLEGLCDTAPGNSSIRSGR